MNINSYQEADEMSAEEIDRRNRETREILWKAGAHRVVDSIADIESVIEDINQRLAAENDFKSRGMNNGQEEPPKVTW